MVDLKYLFINDEDYLFIYFLFFFLQTVQDQTTDLKGMSDLDRKVTHLFCIHLWGWHGHLFALL